MTQRQEARDAKDRVKDLGFEDVFVGLSQDEDGSWMVAVRSPESMDPEDRRRIIQEVGDVGVTFRKVSYQPRISRGMASSIRGNMKHRKANSFVSDDPEEAKDYLRGVVVLEGEGTIDPDWHSDVWIGIVHDGSGFNPGAVIYVNQLSGQHPDEVLQGAHEILVEKDLEDTEHVQELQEEWGEDWYDILTEGYGGMAFGPFDPITAADIVESDKYAKKYIELFEFEG